MFAMLLNKKEGVPNPIPKWFSRIPNTTQLGINQTILQERNAWRKIERLQSAGISNLHSMHARWKIGIATSRNSSLQPISIQEKLLKVIQVPKLWR